MAKKKAEGYLSAKESRRISKENRKITNEFEKKYKRKNVPEEEYLTTMKNPVRLRKKRYKSFDYAAFTASSGTGCIG